MAHCWFNETRLDVDRQVCDSFALDTVRNGLDLALDVNSSSRNDLVLTSGSVLTSSFMFNETVDSSAGNDIFGSDRFISSGSRVGRYSDIGLESGTPFVGHYEGLDFLEHLDSGDIWTSMASKQTNPIEENFDYLMPTCMSQTKLATAPCNWETVFDQSLRALDSDTCSEISVSDRSYLDAKHYTRLMDKNPVSENLTVPIGVELWKRTDAVPLKKEPTAKFDESLQNFLHWPINDIYSDGSWLKRNMSDRQRLFKPRHFSRHSRQHTYNNRSLDWLESSEDDDGEYFPTSHSARFPHQKPLHSILESSVNLDSSVDVDPRSDYESDSDYRTYSDASSEHVYAGDRQRDSNTRSIKSLMASVFEKSERISEKLKDSKIVKKVDRKHTQNTALVYPVFAKNFSNVANQEITKTKANNKVSLNIKDKLSSKGKKDSDSANKNLQVNHNKLCQTSTPRAETAKDESLEKPKSNLKHVGFASDFRMTRVKSDKQKTDKKVVICVDPDHTTNDTNTAKTEQKAKSVVRNSKVKDASEKQSDTDEEKKPKLTYFLSQYQRLVKSLGKKEGELLGFRDLLQKAEDSLSQSETAVESLQQQLERERRANGTNEHLLQELDQLRGVCDQFAREKREHDGHIAELTKALINRDEKLDKANQMLLSAEETINEALDSKEAALMEKDRINLHLKSTMEAKERALEEAFQQSPKTDDAKIHHLQLKLQEKDRLLQEIMDDASETSQRRDQDVRNLRQRLRDQEDEIEELMAKHKKETGDLRRELDSQQSELNRKEHLYQVKLREFETVAQKLDITVGGADNDALQQILAELQSLRGAVQSGDHNIRIEVNPGQSPPRPPGDREAGGKPPRPGNMHSRIPVRRSSSTSSASDDPDHHGKQLTNLKAQNEAMSKTLHATEETVRRQTQKMKHYKYMLIENGLLPKCLSRSNSDPNLANWSPRSPRIGDGNKFRSTENLSRCSLSPLNGATVTNQNDDVEKLMKDNVKLRQQIDGYRRVLKVFQGRSLSPTTTDDSDNRNNSDEEGQQGPEPISSESASCLLENWMDMMDKFLTELSRDDQNGSAHGGTSTTEVSRLRRGLVQARGAIHSLSKESLSGQERVVSSTSNDQLTAADRAMPQSSDSEPSTARDSPPVKCFDTNVNSNTGQGGLMPPLPGHDADAGDPLPRLDADVGDQSIEKLRLCSDMTEGPVSMFSNISRFDNTVFSDKSTRFVKNGGSFMSTEPMRVVRGQSNSSDGGNSDHMSDTFDSGTRPPKFNNNNKDMYDQTFTQSFIERDPLTGIDNTMLQQSMFLELEDMSVDLDTESLRSRSQTPSIPNLENDKLRMRLQKLENLNKALKDELRIHEDLTNKGPKLDGDVLNQHLEELRQLRLRLEKNLKDTDNLQEQLTEELHKPTGPDPQLLNQEATIRDLQQLVQNLRDQLGTCNNAIHEKITIIDEKERVIMETNIQLVKHRDNATRDNSELKTQKDRVNSLEVELHESKGELNKYSERISELELQLQESKSVCDKFTNMVRQLKQGLEQFKVRVDQLEGDVKQHRDLANRYQARTNDLENELQQTVLMVEKYKLESESLRERIGELETDIGQCRQSEEQCRGMLGQSRLKVSDLIAETTTLKERLETQDGEITTVDSELKRYKSTIEDQTKQLHDKANLIQQQARDLNEKSQLLLQKDTICRDQSSEIENQYGTQSQLEAQLNQLKGANVEQKRQIDKQNTIILEIERKLETTRQVETSGARQLEEWKQRSADKDKQIHEAVKKKDKYLNNLKVVMKEMKKYRNELLLTQENLNETSDVNKTLKVELCVHEKLNASRHGTCSEEDKEGMILQLLSEVKQLRGQMERVIERNTELRRSMEQLLSRRNKDDSPARSQGTDATDGQPSPERPKPLGGYPGKLPGGAVERETIIKKFTSEFEHRLNYLESPDTTTSSDSGNIDEMGLTQVRIDSDVRTLFAVGKIDHFETLRKEVSECQVILKGMSTRIVERLKTFITKPAMESMEYSTLKELSMATENLRICLDEESSLIGCFWTSELPAPNEKGEFVNQKLLEQVETLKEQLSYLKTKYKYMTTSVDAATDKLHSTNLQKIIDEDEICRSLQSTAEVISLAKQNLQYTAQQQKTSPPRGKHA